MSHFAMLIIGDNIEKQLKPFQENNMDDCPKEYLKFNDTEAEYRKEWENDTRAEFYCSSSSSAGQMLSEENFKWLEKQPVPTKIDLSIDKENPMQYFKKGGQYRCSYETGRKEAIDNELPVPQIWVKCTDILFTKHPDPTTCFEGHIEVQRIPDPLELSHKHYYKDFETFIKDWAGYSKDPETGKYGYWENPNAKWDWYQIGGRYRGRFVMKPLLTLFSDVYKLGFTEPEINNFVGMYDNHPEKFERISGNYGGKTEDLRKFVKDISATMKEPKGNGNGFLSEKGWSSPDVNEGQADQAFKKDIDFSKIHQTKEDYDKAIRFWEMKIENAEPKTDKEKEEMKWDYYKKEYYTKRYKTKETYAKCMSNFTMWGYIKDGKWFEKGDMGWWGCSGESDEDAVKWELEFYDKVIKPLPDDTLLTVVDCHI